MPEKDARSTPTGVSLADALVVAAGMCVFGLFVHRGGIFVVVSAGGLIVAAVTILCGLRTDAAPAILGIERSSRSVFAWALLGALVGVAVGSGYCVGYGLEPGAIALGRFAPVAALIGATEELVYRGYIQGRVRAFGALGAIILAAACHTAYKCALFAMPSASVTFNMGFFALATLVIGILFGALRERSKSVLPPLLAHAVFDIIVYGSRTSAPWWVWS